MQLTYNQTQNKAFAKYFFGSSGMCLFYLLAVQRQFGSYDSGNV